MIAVQVTYKVEPAFVEENKSNVSKVMDALLANPIEGMQYSTYLLEDGQTFVHINMAKDQETLSSLNELEEFKQFRQALKSSNPISPPVSTSLGLVAAGFEL